MKIAGALYSDGEMKGQKRSAREIMVTKKVKYLAGQRHHPVSFAWDM